MNEEYLLKTKDELKKVLKQERNLYIGERWYAPLKYALLQDHDYLLWKYMVSLRYTEYYNNIGNKLLYWYWQRTKNIRGAKLGITMWKNIAAPGLRIWHYGSIVVNSYARIGRDCQLHGENCIGNKGGTEMGAPVLGDRVDVGVGAKILGDIYIADDVKIGANAVVTKSCYTKGATLVGIPAKEISHGNKN